MKILKSILFIVVFVILYELLFFLLALLLMPALGDFFGSHTGLTIFLEAFYWITGGLYVMVASLIYTVIGAGPGLAANVLFRDVPEWPKYICFVGLIIVLIYSLIRAFSLNSLWLSFLILVGAGIGLQFK